MNDNYLGQEEKYKESLCTLSDIIWYVILPIVVSCGIAAGWIQYLDPQWDGLESKIDLSALNQLNLIIGFLYVGIINAAREKWKRVVKLISEFIITSMTLQKYEPDFTQDISVLKKKLEDFLLNNNDTSRQLENLESLTKLTYMMMKTSQEKDSITQQLVMQVKGIVEALDRHYFQGEPTLFTYHLRFLLLLYFGSVPAQLYNAYGPTGTMILYPIIVYFLFAVVLWSNALGSPLKHPGLLPRFAMLKGKADPQFNLKNDLRRDLKFKV